MVLFIGEDATSFERHNRLICAEYRKSAPNKFVINELADLSFTMRREDILNLNSIQEVLTKYPFLKEEDEVIYNICNIFIS